MSSTGTNKPGKGREIPVTGGRREKRTYCPKQIRMKAKSFLDSRNTQSKKKRLTSEQKEFAEIRQKIGLSQLRFAAALGIKRDRVVNIENGRIRNVPKDEMEAARELLVDQSRLEQVDRLTRVPMTKLLKDWSEKLGIEYEGSYQYDRTISDLLGLHPNTIYRWRIGSVRPELETLLELDRTVNIIAERIQPSRLKNWVDSQAKTETESETDKRAS